MNTQKHQSTILGASLLSTGKFLGGICMLAVGLLLFVQSSSVHGANISLCSFDNEGITTGDDQGRIKQSHRVDWNGNGIDDVVKSVTVGLTQKPLIGLSDGNGNITNEVIDLTFMSDEYADFGFADFNGNGHVDIYFTLDSVHSIFTDDKIAINQGDNTFYLQDVDILNSTDGTHNIGENVFVDDFTGNGVMDVYVSTNDICLGGHGSPYCYDILFINDGSGSFDRVVLENTWGFGASHVHAGDINNDGNIEILATIKYPTGGSSENKVVYFADGLGGYTQKIVPGGPKAIRSVLIDMNDDGILDVFVGTESGSDYYQIYNPVTDTFSSPVNFQSSGSSRPSDPVDYGNNGKTDLVVTEFEPGPNINTVTLYINQGNGNFYPAELGEFVSPIDADLVLGMIFEMDAAGAYKEIYFGGGLRNNQNDGLYFYAMCDQQPGDPVCGNGIVEQGEECETSTPGCSEECQRIEPECTLTVNGGSSTTVPAGVSVNFESTVTGGVIKSDFNFGNGDSTSWSEQIQYAYSNLGTYFATFSVVNPSYPDLNKTCGVTVNISGSSCGNGIVEPGEQCGEYDASGNPLISCSGDAVCNQATCTCHNVCPLVPGDPIELIVQPFNFGDGYDIDLTGLYNGSGANVDHTYNWSGSYTTRLKIINPGNNSVYAYCEEDVEITENLCGNGVKDPGEQCGEPGLSCGETEICNPTTCLCMNSCPLVEDTTVIEECDDGMHCSDLQTNCTEDSDCVNIGDELCLPRDGTGCNNMCQLEYCGDGIVQPELGEECDLGSFCIEGSIGSNGNDVSGVECTTNPIVCGNVANCQPIQTELCTVTCKYPFCGDGVVQEYLGETCDPGSFCADGTECTTNPHICANGPSECLPRDTEECSATCDEQARCGDGIIQPELGEECDDGANNSDSGRCNRSCELTYCGDGIPQSPNGIGFEGGDPSQSFGEQCDDGKHCSNLQSCTEHSDCEGQGLGDELCIPRDGTGCNANCQAPLPEEGVCVERLYISGGYETFPESLSYPGDLCEKGIPVAILPGDVDNYDPANFTGIILDGVDPAIIFDLYDLGANRAWRCDGSETDEFCQTSSCGDGILQYNGYANEECDDGNTVSGDGCSETCKIEAPLQPVDFDNNPSTQDISCIDRTGQKDGVLPVAHPDEFLPVYWEAETFDNFIDRDAQTCAEFDVNPYGGLLGSTMICDFVLSNADQEFTLEGQDYTFQTDCYTGVNTKSNDPIITVDNPIIADALTNHEGYGTNGVLDPQEVEKLLGTHLLDLPSILDKQAISYGQFKIKLTNIHYQYCAKEAVDLRVENAPVEFNKLMPQVTLNPEEPICEAKASITRGYLTQKGFTLQEIPNAELADFLSYANVQLAPEGTPVDPNTDILTTIPEGDQGKQRLFQGFVDQYNKSGIIQQGAADIGGQTAGRDATATIRKVPNDTIFFYTTTQTEATQVTINNDVIDSLLSTFNLNPQQPFTFVVEDENVTLNIDNDLTRNGAYIIKGDISFNPQSCDDNNLVEGIFIAKGIFTAETIRNNDPNASERCAGGSLKVDGVLIGQGIDESFANARRSTLSSWTDPESDIPGLFDDSLTGQGRELFNVCLLPNLLNFIKGAPGNIIGSGDPRFAQPVVIREETVNGELGVKYIKLNDLDDDQPENICTIASFDRGRHWMENASGLEDPDCTIGSSCTLHEAHIKNILDPAQQNIVPLRVFKDYADQTLNYHIKEKMNADYTSILAQLGGNSVLPKELQGANTFICDDENIQGCIKINHTISSIENFFLPGSDIVYRPARNIATNKLFNERLITGSDITLSELRSAYAGFKEVETEFGVNNLGLLDPLLPQGGLLAALQALDGGWYFYYTMIQSGLPILFDNNSFTDIYDQFLDYQRLTTQESNLSEQNLQRSESIFEGSAVLLQLNAAKWTQLSPGLKSYLDRTIVEK